MRKIKYRMFDKTNQEYRTVGMCIDSSGKVGTAGDNSIIEQCTGLKDMLDKEIYEGDIVEFTVPDGFGEFSGRKSYYEVFWDEDRAGFATVTHQSHIFEGLSYEECKRSLIVVGNINENPQFIHGDIDWKKPEEK